MNWLDAPNYEALRLRLENAHAAVEAATVEARRRVRLNEGDARRGRVQKNGGGTGRMGRTSPHHEIILPKQGDGRMCLLAHLRRK